eukprot:TRINITY_DN3949_c0_g1_i13.p1 TRINITY_DN3949_c0_g1~~TRINITY_DN3949_c0_g1_i13.p1  ORF type:complete len:606 (+),score=236.75 TRINITY_DN3949_c0_g1_i13:66-1820(+)
MRVVVCFLALLVTVNAWSSNWVFQDANGNLNYRVDANQNRIPDYSYAGYDLGLNDPPSASAFPIRKTLNATQCGYTDGQPNDCTLVIQLAINEVASYPLNTSTNIRGALQLAAGYYRIDGQIFINVTGVLLIGAGGFCAPNNTASYASCTVLAGTSTLRRNVVAVGLGTATYPAYRPYATAARAWLNVTGVDIVPVGSRVLRVSSTSLFTAGALVFVAQTWNDAMLRAVKYGDTGVELPWHYTDAIYSLRNVESVDAAAGTITLNAPIYHAINNTNSPGWVSLANKFSYPFNVGLENVQVEIWNNGSFQNMDHATSAINVNGAYQSFVRGVSAYGFSLSGVIVNFASRVTIDNCRAFDPIGLIEPGYFYNLNAADHAQLVLFKNSQVRHGRHNLIQNGAYTASGIVFYNIDITQGLDASEPHRQFGPGILFDNIRYSNPALMKYPRGYLSSMGLGLYHRSEMGLGHGYSAVWSTLWNIDTTTSCVCVQNPPIGANWAIGIKATEVTGTKGKCCPFTAEVGYIDNQTGAMDIPSLYLAQLDARKNNKQAIVFDDPNDAYVEVDEEMYDEQFVELDESLEDEIDEE